MTLHVFGYGSLVHGGTHDYPALYPARLCGWRRAWRHTKHRAVAFLTIVPDEACEIWGAVAPVPDASWDALDAREWAYARHDVTDVVTSPVRDRTIAAYAIAPDEHFAPTPDHPVLQSYLDTVLSGYEAVFGSDGIAHFIETTSGWGAPILQDRSAPRYPRSQPISADALKRYDNALDAIGITRLSL